MYLPKTMAGLAVLILVGMVAVACGGDGNGGGNGNGDQSEVPSPPVSEVAVSLAEWSVTAAASVGSGEVRFDVRNDGEAVHAFAIYQGGVLDGDAIDGGTLLAQTKNVPARETATLQASLEPGGYWLVCPIPGHTALGMSAQLVVDPP